MKYCVQLYISITVHCHFVVCLVEVYSQIPAIFTNPLTTPPPGKFLSQDDYYTNLVRINLSCNYLPSAAQPAITLKCSFVVPLVEASCCCFQNLAHDVTSKMTTVRHKTQICHRFPTIVFIKLLPFSTMQTHIDL